MKSIQREIASPPAWIATDGIVTSCRFRFARLNTFTLGIQTGEKYLITFDYKVDGRLYSDEFSSPVAIPQNQAISLTYNPLHPEQNSCSGRDNPDLRSTPLIAVGVAGSIVLSLLWLGLMRGCN